MSYNTPLFFKREKFKQSLIIMGGRKKRNLATALSVIIVTALVGFSSHRMIAVIRNFYNATSLFTDALLCFDSGDTFVCGFVLQVEKNYRMLSNHSSGLTEEHEVQQTNEEETYSRHAIKSHRDLFCDFKKYKKHVQEYEREVALYRMLSFVDYCWNECVTQLNSSSSSSSSSNSSSSSSSSSKNQVDDAATRSSSVLSLVIESVAVITGL
ncbi:hypothetical protein BD770DRAFT_426428 [Pilaira anomala]|nr:hypothetical protein BD770DRAFT_426428 [Pilaira anomala]